MRSNKLQKIHTTPQNSLWLHQYKIVNIDYFMFPFVLCSHVFIFAIYNSILYYSSMCHKHLIGTCKCILNWVKNTDVNHPRLKSPCDERDYREELTKYLLKQMYSMPSLQVRNCIYGSLRQKRSELPFCLFKLLKSITGMVFSFFGKMCHQVLQGQEGCAFSHWVLMAHFISKIAQHYNATSTIF